MLTHLSGLNSGLLCCHACLFVFEGWGLKWDAQENFSVGLPQAIVSLSILSILLMLSQRTSTQCLHLYGEQFKPPIVPKPMKDVIRKEEQTAFELYTAHCELSLIHI